MRIKWLVVLSAACVGIILIFLITLKQDVKRGFEPPEETAPLDQITYPLQQPSIAMPQETAETTPLPKSAITIIGKPAAVPEKQIPAAAAAVSYEAFPEDPGEGNSAQPGITKIGKYPAKKESQDMQSKGIVLY